LAVDLYSETLELIRCQAVESVSPERLFRQGLRDLDWALQNPAFVRLAFPGGLGDDARQSLHHEIRTRWQTARVASRAEAARLLSALLLRWQQNQAASPSALTYVFLQGATAAVDEHSAYLPPIWREKEALASRAAAGSIGMALRKNGDDLVVE